MLEIIIHPIGILVAGIAGYTIGMLWYSPALFMKPWLSGLGKTEDDLKKPTEYRSKLYMMGLMIYTLIVCIVVAFALSSILNLIGAKTILETVGVSMLLCFGFIVTVKFTDMLYTLDGPHWGIRAQKLFFVNAGYYVVMFITMGIILHYLS